MGEVILVCSGKGGVGKSTLGYFCGRNLAKRDKRVLLIEFDTGLRSLDTMAGLKDVSIYHLGDILDESCTPDQAICVCPGENNLHIICAPATPDSKLNESVLLGVLSGLRRIYDYILLDAPAGVGFAFYMGAKVCDHALVVVTADSICVRDGATVCDLLRDMGKSARLVINKFDKKLFKEQPFFDLDEVIDTVGAQLIGLVPASGGLHTAATTGTYSLQDRAVATTDNIARRLMGEDVPLLIF